MSGNVIRWLCPNCIAEWDEPFCDVCGKNLHAMVNRPRVPGVRSARDLERVRLMFGPVVAAQVAVDDALTEMLKPEKP